MSLRIVIVGSVQSIWAAPAFARALEQLGVEVFFFDWGSMFSRGMIGRFESRFMCGPAVRRAHKTLLKYIDSINPDLLLIHNGRLFGPETIAKLKQRWWVAGYMHDDPFGAFSRKAYFRLFKRAIPFYNSHHVIRPENIYEYQQLGVKHVKILMTHYSPWMHYPMRGNDSHYEFEVVFIGHAERDRRIDYVTDIVNAGIPLRIFGDPKYWRRYLPPEVQRRLPPITPRLGKSYARTISFSKICLAFHSQANRDRYSHRVFEIPACRGFLLAERTDIMRSLYEEGKEAEFFDSSDELVDKIRFYLKHDSAREQIAQKGYERCTKSGYDVVSRMRQWLMDIQEFRKQ